MKRVFCRTLISLLLLCMVAETNIATAQQAVDDAWNKGLAWLLTHQRADGSWIGTDANGQERPGTEIITTTEALQALHKAGVKNYSYAAGLAWVGAAKPSSIDGLARKIFVLDQAGLQTATFQNQLMEWQNNAMSWGTYRQFDPAFPDAALASKAIRQTGTITSEIQNTIKDSLRAMLDNQLTTVPANGSWSYYPGYILGASQSSNGRDSSLVATAYNILELHAAFTDLGMTWIYSKSVEQGRDDGVTWLLTQQNSDGGFGASQTSSIFETALAYTVLETVDPQNTATTDSLNYLLAQQDATDGSWKQEALHTALVLAALPAPATPLLDFDGDGIPDGVESVLGTDPLNSDSRDLLLSGPSAQQGQSSGGSGSGGNPPPIVPDGDINEDGFVDVADLALAERIALGLITPTSNQISHGDVAPVGLPDGTIDVADLERLGRMIVQGGQP